MYELLQKACTKVYRDYNSPSMDYTYAFNTASAILKMATKELAPKRSGELTAALARYKKEDLEEEGED